MPWFYRMEIVDI
ncbi:hypothetical protein OIU84_026579, partial [Salix udensis]